MILNAVGGEYLDDFVRLREEGSGRTHFVLTPGDGGRYGGIGIGSKIRFLQDPR